MDVTKYPKEEIIGESAKLLKSGWHDEKLFNTLSETISKGNTFQGYLRNKAKDGSIYWVKTVINPSFDENNNIKWQMTLSSV